MGPCYASGPVGFAWLPIGWCRSPVGRGLYAGFDPPTAPLKDHDTFEARLSRAVFSRPSVILHTVGFAVWLCTRGFGVDDGSYQVLTGIVSLEAIYITLWVGIAVNQQSEQQQQAEATARRLHTQLLEQNDRTMEAQSEVLETILDLLEDGR